MGRKSDYAMSNIDIFDMFNHVGYGPMPYSKIF